MLLWVERFFFLKPFSLGSLLLQRYNKPSSVCFSLTSLEIITLLHHSHQKSSNTVPGVNEQDPSMHVQQEQAVTLMNWLYHVISSAGPVFFFFSDHVQVCIYNFN